MEVKMGTWDGIQVPVFAKSPPGEAFELAAVRWPLEAAYLGGRCIAVRCTESIKSGPPPLNGKGLRQTSVEGMRIPTCSRYLETVCKSRP